MNRPLRWNDDRYAVELLDQTRLPSEEVWMYITRTGQMAEAIRSLRVRGAPAIGIAAAYGLALALREVVAKPFAAVMEAADVLASTRLTAVNLSWAMDRMRRVARQHADASQHTLQQIILQEAMAVEKEDQEAGKKIGRYGLALLKEGMCVMTHCHTGGLATSGYGTALAPLLISTSQRVSGLSAVVNETRPLLQGSRITAWELQRAGIPVTVITDSMAGHVMLERKADVVMVGADRIAANGDVANKIGTYALAVLAKQHRVPFYVLAPMTTIDFATSVGANIPIEERPAVEITARFGTRTAPDSVGVYNPAFDITSASFISAIVTDRGIVRPPYAKTLAGLRRRKPRP